MKFFGKSEDELKKIAADLADRQTELDNLECAIRSRGTTLAHERELLAADMAAFESERSNYAVELKRSADSIADAKADLERRRSEMAFKEAEAKANFVDAQREAFKSVFERRQGSLDAHQSNLDAVAGDVASRMATLHAREADLANRELAMAEREQRADSGFADKTKALADEATRQHRMNQSESQRLERLVAELTADRQEFEEKKAELTRREQAVIVAEQMRDAGFADERAALNAELRNKRAEMETEIAKAREHQLSELEHELVTLKAKRLEHLSQVETFEQDRIRAEIAMEREQWKALRDQSRQQMEADCTELEKTKGRLTASQHDIAEREARLQLAEEHLKRKDQRLEQVWQKRNDELEESIEARFAERRKSHELAESSRSEELSRLRESLQCQTDLLGGFEQLKRQLGGKDPAEIIRDLNSQTDELKRLREELATRPTDEIRERYQALEVKERHQKARVDQLEKQIASNEAKLAQAAELRRRNSELDAENRALVQKAAIFEGAANEAEAELTRLRAAYERPAEVAARRKEIEIPHITVKKVKEPKKADLDEMTWLTQIGDACDSYGLHFNPRILKAFHAALKTAEWSPLTILAGVSGTGKSELPRLYSHFGGIVFEPISVQPTWDSQESMLGFFNSIDNKFDAQPLLRFLAQSQKQWLAKSKDGEGYPGLSTAVCLVLLDEMNLAHPELYFAEFLSKLELRRGMKRGDVPVLPVKIGAGMPPYELPLGRNVLWTGTMNQDETTKSLSDKVIDRSIIIHFPRPTELKRRLKLEALDETNRGTALHLRSWQSWLAQSSQFSEEDVKPFKSFIETINAALEVAGRAIGHRIWQSVEYYMANYPDVRAAQQTSDKGLLARAMHTAFEDQLVQKVMPKLRGIDTRGKSKTECLDRIRGQLVTGIGGNSFNLAEDFELACELGYGQFIWQSANYLNASDTVADSENAGDS
jgi:hypothetical protein